MSIGKRGHPFREQKTHRSPKLPKDGLCLLYALQGSDLDLAGRYPLESLIRAKHAQETSISATITSAGIRISHLGISGFTTFREGRAWLLPKYIMI